MLGGIMKLTNWFKKSEPEKKSNLKVFDFYVQEVQFNPNCTFIFFDSWNKFIGYINYKVDVAEFYHLPDKKVVCFYNDIVIIYVERLNDDERKNNILTG